mgnify:CR=1 FL=1|jgi:hypothetical protein
MPDSGLYGVIGAGVLTTFYSNNEYLKKSEAEGYNINLGYRFNNSFFVDVGGFTNTKVNSINDEATADQDENTKNEMDKYSGVSYGVQLGWMLLI